MPKTMPALVVGGNKVRPAVITAAGLAAAVGASVALLLVILRIGP
jgi:fumarate reductase subunit C